MSRIDEEIAKANFIRISIQNECGEDEDLIRDMIEGETDLKGLLEWIIRKYADEKVMSTAIKMRQEELATRRASSDNRIEYLKNKAQQVLNAWGVQGHKFADGTINKRAVPPKPVVTDESLLPDEYWRVKREVDKTKINEAVEGGATIKGVSFDNGGETITIRLK